MIKTLIIFILITTSIFGQSSKETQSTTQVAQKEESIPIAKDIISLRLGIPPTSESRTITPTVVGLEGKDNLIMVIGYHLTVKQGGATLINDAWRESGESFTVASDGVYSVTVRARIQGSDYTATKNVSIDTTVPVPSNVTISGASGTIAINNPTFSVSASNGYRYQYNLNNTAWSADRTMGTSISLTGLSNAAHTLYVRVKNSEGVFASTVSRSFTVNYQPSMDDLTYSYSGGRLVKVIGATPSNHYDGDFDSNGTSNQYTYDNNGNVTKDLNRGITSITYTEHNLPKRVTLSSGTYIDYTYNQSGQRLIKKINGTIVSKYIRDTQGTILAELDANGTVKYKSMIGAGEILGKSENLSGTYEDYYFLKDHLGNTRVTVKNNDGDQSITLNAPLTLLPEQTIEPTNVQVVSATDFYPFGATMKGREFQNNSEEQNKFKYQGKERDLETGYDYFEARFYDSAIGRFLQVDPLAEKFKHINPYAAMNNNPLKYTDFTGMAPDVALHVDPNGASGNGHTSLYFQYAKGQWYKYDQGAAGENSSPEQSAGFVSGSDAKAGVSIVKVDAPPEGSVIIRTTKEQDVAVTKSAIKSAKEHNSGKKDYNLYSNNCTDAATEVLNNAGIEIENPAMTVKPNSWFDEVKKQTETIGTTGTPVPAGKAPVDNPQPIKRPKYEIIKQKDETQLDKVKKGEVY